MRQCDINRAINKYKNEKIITAFYFFNLMDDINKNELLNNIRIEYIDNLKNEDYIINKFHITNSCFGKIKKYYNIHRSKEQSSKLSSNTRLNKSEIEKRNINAKRNETNLKKYGVINQFQRESVKKQVKQTKLKNYGNESYVNSKKAKQTKLERYGENYLSNVMKNVWNNYSDDKKEAISKNIKNSWNEKTQEEIQKINEKRKKTNIEKYNVNWIMQSDDAKQKAKQTKLERYGNEKYNNIEKTKYTNLQNYGVEYSWQREDVKKQIKQTNLKTKGVDHPWKDINVRKKCLNTAIYKYGNTNNIEQIVKTNLERYNIPYYCMSEKCKLSKIHSNSKINDMFYNHLKLLNIIAKREFPLKNRSYDFKVGNTLIELDPTYTHNSTKPAIFVNRAMQKQALNKYYHLEKTKLAQENGFRCIHIFDWDNKDKIINMFTSKIIIGARKCTIKKVLKKECDEFLNLYHLQNTCRGQIVCYGLYYNDELLQIMTFGKPRYNKNYEWELLRLCSHKDYQIIGGSERLWKHFLREQNPTNVISYCDNSKFTGKVYENLGMELIDKGVPACHWSKGMEHITNNLLNQRGYDQLFGTNYGKGTSNRELMIENGWLEVYDCGQSSWSYHRK